MRVLVIPSWYPTGEDKLMGIYHKEYCAALAKEQNIQVNMLYIDRQPLSKPFNYLFIKKKNIDFENNYSVYKYCTLDYNSINPILALKLYTKKLERAFKDYLKNNPFPDVIHAQVTLPAGYAACILGKKYNSPVVVTEHASGFMKFFEGSNKEYGEYVLNNSYYTTVSNMMKNKIVEMGYKCDVIPNLVETDIFHNKHYKRGKTLNLVAVSAFRKGKRIDDIIKALNIIVLKHTKNIHLNIVGDGYLMDRYKNLVSELNLQDYVTFYGRKTKHEIAQILSQNDIFVVASLFETFCIPGVEALASGIPVVSTKCFGPEEYIDSACGELCEVDNPQSLADTIMRVAKKLDKYDSKYLRNKAEQFSPKNVCLHAIDIYNEVIKTK